MDRKGISPVIATVLLVLLGLVLAVIFFLWAKGFVSERIEKFGSPIESVCENINFDAEISASEGKVNIVNRGNVPLYGLEIRKKEIGSIKSAGVFIEHSINIGESGSIELKESVKAGDNFIVVPIILGLSNDVKKSYTCKDEQGVEIEVIP